jgi:serine phosphatase RsbU (regulator of sigma subunit)
MPPEVTTSPVLAISIENGPIRVVALTQAVTTIGRSVDNVLEIPDPNMSRRHCVIEQREGGEVILTDCNSSNGTKVNGERVISQELKTSDTIECGSTRMHFASSRGDLERLGLTLPLEARLPKPAAGARGKPGRRPSETLYDTSDLKPMPPRSAEAHVLAHERDDLRKLLEITKELNQVHDLRRLLETIIDAAIELMAAERGFLILLNDGQMKIEIARNMGQTSINDESLRVSTQVCRQVIENGEAVLTTDAQADNHFGRFKSVVGLNLRSIICVPFRIKSETFGTVYLDASHAGAFSQRDVALLEAFSDQAALAIENARLLYAAKQRERIEQELRIASQIQRKLLPRQVPEVPGLELYGWMHSAKEVGGDYYDFVPSKDGESLYFCVGDVSGKGVPAGLVMASARSALHSLIEAGVGSTRDIVLSLNRFLCADLDQEMFLSFVLMHYDPRDGSIHYTGAGHENILIWRHSTSELEVLRTGGRVLGVTTRAEDQFQERTLELTPGDTIVLYTDGVTETINDTREQFELERLVEAARRHAGQVPKQTLHAILGEVLRFKGRVNQRDDITLMVVRRSPLEEGNVSSQTGRQVRVQDEPTRPSGVLRRPSLLD